MNSLINLTEDQWSILKLKFSRKYTHLTAEDLNFIPGEEHSLVTRLAQRVNRPESYILFTLQKELVNLSSNRL
ncbi:hypothetical protein J5U18_00170 [Sphingobacteriaceae bacterium WQ 2009]|uniref:Uncharacterized protein n=1 Tax=Rhinopithecimicrobium faecis TaxID=2820698 RepID=A0A8T4H582_9SPHI|nr:hypothetical protein [Sphingobacteriaceae bacterium WQ 2009]